MMSAIDQQLETYKCLLLRRPSLAFTDVMVRDLAHPELMFMVGSQANFEMPPDVMIALNQGGWKSITSLLFCLGVAALNGEDFKVVPSEKSRVFMFYEFARRCVGINGDSFEGSRVICSRKHTGSPSKPHQRAVMM
jgi:hypothetical protein